MSAPETLLMLLVFFCVGEVSSLNNIDQNFFYGDSIKHPRFSGGDVFYSKNSALIGIVHGSEWDRKETAQYGHWKRYLLNASFDNFF